MYHSPERSSCAFWNPRCQMCFKHFSPLSSGLPIFMTRWEMMLNGPILSVMASRNYPSTQQSRVIKTSSLDWASWGLKNLSPGTCGPTPSLSFLAELYLYCSAWGQCTYIIQKSGDDLVPGAICTIWCLSAVLDSSRATWAVWPAPVCPVHSGKSTRPSTLGILRNHEISSVTHHHSQKPKD